MSSKMGGPGPQNKIGLLVDTNLLVLFVVGSVNRNRIQHFKRTSQYGPQHYDLLTQFLNSFQTLYATAHVLAEVSNLTDLPGDEGLQARRVLKETISSINEPLLPSLRAAENSIYENLGLTDAAVATVAHEHNCTVLTDDLDLYLRPSEDQIDLYKFTHLCAPTLGF